MKKKILFVIILGMILSGCHASPAMTATTTPLPTETATPQPTPTITITPTPTAMPLISEISSPLQDIELSDLRLITSYAYSFIYPFSEGPDDDKNHPAVDLSFYKFKDWTTVVGHPIQAILPGKVVTLTNNVYPYGNSILIETPLSWLSPDLIDKMQIGKPYSLDEIAARSPCQPDQTRISWSQTDESVYTLYAHMQSPTTVKVGDEIVSGEVIGAVGATGHAVVGNEHLHLEVRVGPSNASFGTISEYISSATDEERYNYCIWALSEVFLPINPSNFWVQSSNSGQ
jgi:murein DD-endopeptidase MepM/ murein hydrolase activator NlpD